MALEYARITTLSDSDEDDFFNEEIDMSAFEFNEVHLFYRLKLFFNGNDP